VRKHRLDPSLRANFLEPLDLAGFNGPGTPLIAVLGENLDGVATKCLSSLKGSVEAPSN
jgi:hypothetical protein